MTRKNGKKIILNSGKNSFSDLTKLYKLYINKIEPKIKVKEQMNKKVYAFALLAILVGVLVIATIETPEASSINLKVIETKVLEAGDNQIHGFIYHNGFLWASTRTSPCRILKINKTLDYQRIILSPGLDNGKDIVAAKGYIWVILHSSPSRIVKVDPATMEWEIAIELEGLSRGDSLEYAYGHLWAGCSEKLARIDLEINYTVTVYDYSEVIAGTQFHALTSGGGYLWGSCPRMNFLGINPTTTILRINPDDPTQYEELLLDGLVTDDIFYLYDALYLGTEDFFSSSRVYRIFNNLTYTTGMTRDTKCYGIFHQPWGYFWGAYVGKPGRIIKFNSELEVEGIFCLPSGFHDANEIAFIKTNIYVVCYGSPARIVRLDTRNIF